MARSTFSPAASNASYNSRKVSRNPSTSAGQTLSAMTSRNLCPAAKLAPDVPEFLEVRRRPALGGLDPERGIAARPAAAGDEVGALGLLGQREERLGLGLGAVDQILRNPVIAHDRKAIFLEAWPSSSAKAVGLRSASFSETDATVSLVRMSVMD